MKISFHKLADQAIKFGGPIVLAAIAQKLLTGKFDVKAVARDAVAQALGARV